MGLLLGSATVQETLGFPRVAAVIISGWPTGDHDTTDIDRYALANWTTLNFTSSTTHPRVVPGTGGLNDQEILDRMRGVNADIVLMNWVTAIHTEDGPGTAPGSYVQSIIDQLEANTGPGNTDWYGYGTNKDTGTHDGANNSAVLVDSGGGWTINEHVGKAIFNLTDGSKGGVTANTSTTVTATLTNGTDDDWDNSDSYMILNYGGGDWDQNLFLNWSDFITADGSGDKLPGYVAKLRYNDNYQNADWAGYLVDVQRTEANSPAQNLDMDQDGDTDESVRETTGATIYKEYQAEFVVKMNALIGGSDHLATGNIGNTWVPARNKVTPKPEYVGMAHGGLWEGAMGKSFSPDITNPGDVDVWKNQIGKPWFEFCNLNDQPGLEGLLLDIPAATPAGGVAPMVMFGTVVDLTEYDSVRYYITTCLMCDGYINIQPDIGAGWTDWVLYDEFHNGTANKWNYLGAPIDEMVDTSVKAADWNWPGNTTGVYGRRFQKGAVFVNPDGNGDKSIDITTFGGGPYKHVNGLQAPTVNTGNDITGAETLPEKDGWIVVDR